MEKHVAKSQIDRVMELVREIGVVRPCDLKAKGLPQNYLWRLHSCGLLARVGRGLYAMPEGEVTENRSLAEAAKRVPHGVICLLSALRFHRLTTQNPFEVWMTIDRKAWRPRVEHPPMRFFYLSGPPLLEGVEEHKVSGVTIRVFSAAKTVADCFKFRNKIGIDVAVEALRDYRRKHPKRLEALWRFAEVDRVTRVIRPYLEAGG